MKAAVLACVLAAASAACAGSAPDALHPAREAGCPVRRFPAGPTIPVDELGVVDVECRGGGGACERELLDVVCRRGGDVAWGMADNAIGAARLVAHAAHSKRATGGARERGCAVQVITDGAPPMRTENIGPVIAYCDRDDPRDTCLRELEDQACLLGGDVLWQVDGPLPDGDKQKMHGRAAHTK